MHRDYQHLIGKTQQKVLELMGDEFNDPNSRKWTFMLPKKKWEKRRTLIVEFSDDKMVSKVYIKKIFL